MANSDNKHPSLKFSRAKNKKLNIPSTESPKQPAIANENDFSPIKPVPRKKRTNFFIMIGAVTSILTIFLTIISVQQSSLKNQYLDATSWNYSVGTYYEAFKKEKDFYQYMHTSWLRLVELDDLEKNTEYIEAAQVLDATESVGRERTIPGIVSLLKEKTPTYKYFDSGYNKENKKIIEAKKKALLIYDQEEIIYSEDFMYGRYYKSSDKEWCHVLERVDGKFRISKYQPTSVLENRSIENFNKTAVFLNNKRLSDEELKTMIKRIKGF